MDQETINWFKNALPEEKLGILRSEVRQSLVIIAGYAEVMKKKVDSGEDPSMMAEFSDWLGTMIEATKKIDEVIEILTTK